jgi:hypothetical protein
LVIFEQMFRESGGKPVKYKDVTLQMMDEIALGATNSVLIRFLSVNSEWRQGIALTTEGTFFLNMQKIKNGIVLWQDTAPQEVDFSVSSKSRILYVKNVWDTGDGVIQSWHNGSAMIVDVNSKHRRYRCNDGLPDDDFDDLVFELVIV